MSGTAGDRERQLRSRLRMQWSSVMQNSLPDPRRSPEQHLADESIRLRDQARVMPPGVARDRLIRMARQAETASRIDAWVMSPGLRSPE
jgi:hypothetical protein